MSKAKKQHYVPQFLLKKFAIRKGRKAQVWVMDKEKESCFLSSTRDIAHENRFYECQSGNGDTIQLEGMLQKVDGVGSNIINKILNTKSLRLSENDKYGLSLFIAFQIARTTSVEKEVEAMRKYMVKNIGSDVHVGEDAKTIGEYSKEDDKQAALRNMIVNTPEFTEALRTRAWYLCESPENDHFIVCDNPVTRDNMFDQSPYGNLGILSPGVEMYLPLSPRYCLYIICSELAAEITSKVFVQNQFRNSHLTGSPIIMSTENIKRANSLQVRFAERFVFSKSKSDLDIAFEMIADNPKFKEGFRARIG